MKGMIRWLAKIVGSALTLALIFVLLPYISRFVAKILPDESGAAIKVSAIIASRLEESARLETLHVEEDGVLNYDIQAAFIGSVGNINVNYRYEAAFGIDLSKVEMAVAGNTVTFRLPGAELIQDSITPLDTYRNDFWYPGFSDNDYAKLLENEREARRTAYLTGEQSASLHASTQKAFETTIESWLKETNANITFLYEPLSTNNE